jgi:hypothetical protein
METQNLGTSPSMRAEVQHGFSRSEPVHAGWIHYSVLTIIVALILSSQPAWAQSVEFRINDVNNNAGMDWPPRIAVADDGSFLVNWSGGSQLLAPTGEQIGDDLPIYGLWGNILSLGPDRWGYLVSRDSSWQTGMWTWESLTKYYVLIYDAQRVVDSTVALMYTGDYGSSTDDGSSTSSLYRLHLCGTEHSMLLSWNMHISYTNGTYLSQSMYSGASFLDPTDSVAEMYDAPASALSTYDPDLGLIVCSLDGTPYSYRRTRSYSFDPSRAYVFRRLDRSTAKIAAILGTDTISGLRCGPSDYFLPYDDSRADVILLRGVSDTLIVRMYDFENNNVSERDLAAGVSRYRSMGSSGMYQSGMYDDYADFAHTRLASGRHILVWSRKEPDGKVGLYVSAFERTWEMIGAPRRVSVRREREQIRPAVALHDDTLIIAWLDSRDRNWGVYMKRIPLSGVVSVTAAEAPDDETLDLFPNPVDASAPRMHVRISGSAAGSGTLRVVDLLGRSMLTHTVDGAVTER